MKISSISIVVNGGIFTKQITFNAELNDLKIIICLRKTEVTVERISVCNVIENLAEHGIPSAMLLYQCVIDMLQ